MSPQRTAIVIVASTRAAAGIYEDRSGPIAVDFLRRKGFGCPDARIVPDAEIAAAVDAAFAEKPAVILTSGGTGLTQDDRTVEAVSPHITRELPGIAVAFWQKGLESVPTAVASRAIAGVNDSTFAMTLPGSTGGVKGGCAILEELIVPIVDMLEGKHEH